MEKEFVPYELALRLKQLGFDEHCFGIYDMDTRQFIQNILCTISDTCTNEAMGCISDVNWITAPTFSQAFRWFRDKYNIEVKPMTVTQGINKYYNLSSIKPSSDGFVINNDFNIFTVFEEAELACLEKLIEIVIEKS